MSSLLSFFLLSRELEQREIKSPPAYLSLHLKEDPPSCLVIYTLLHVELGVQNTLICHVTGFYPAPVNITWNKNEQKVTEGTSTSILFPNKDGSFKQTSRLDLIPKKRDVYSCTVEHVGLTQPTTKFDGEKIQPNCFTLYCFTATAISRHFIF
uniref:Ig-like domain-containing protein n=1 Tax=Oreochromis niloticus TaxID=8128 RepID=A0A669BXL9_ORENI